MTASETPSPEDQPLLEAANPDLDAAAANALREARKLWEIADARRMTFPDLEPEGVLRQIKRALAPSWENRPARQTEWPAPEADGLLGLLRREADQIRTQQSHEQQHTAQITFELARVLHRVCVYLHDMVSQLNVIHPLIPRRYPVLDRYEFANLTWQHGFVDHYSLPQQVEDTALFVNFAYHLASDAPPLVFERDASVAERFRLNLFDAGLETRLEEIRLDHQYVDRVRFIVQPEVKVSVTWEVDAPQRAIKVHTHNLERLGRWEERSLTPEQLTPELLERLGSLILGHPKVFSWP